MREMMEQDCCAEHGEAQEDKTEDGFDEAEEVWVDAMRDEANDDG